MTPPPRDPGQASLEYVGALLLVAAALVLAGAAVAGAELAEAPPRALRAALCRVVDGICTPEQARAEGLDPCTIAVRSKDERARATIAFVRLERGDTLVVERRSDGTASVQALDRSGLGGEAGVGVSFAALGLEGQATLGAGARYQGGRVWEFETAGAAERFAARIAEDETLLGELRGRLPGGGRRPRLPAPDAVAREGAGELEGALTGRLPVGGRDGALELEASVGAVLGRTTRPDRTTWHLRLSSEALGSLGVVVAALGVEATREGVLEYTTDSRGRPVSVAVRAAAGLAGDLRVFGARTDVGRLAGALRDAAAKGDAGGRGGLAAEVTLELDLRDPANLAAAEAVLRPGADGRLAALRRLGGRLDADAQVGVAVLRTATRRDRSGGGLRLGVSLTGELTRTTQTKDLVQAWAARGGGPLRDREDCRAAG